MNISDEWESEIIARLQNNGSPCFGPSEPDRIIVRKVTQGFSLEWFLSYKHFLVGTWTECGKAAALSKGSSFHLIGCIWLRMKCLKCPNVLNSVPSLCPNGINPVLHLTINYPVNVFYTQAYFFLVNLTSKTPTISMSYCKESQSHQPWAGQG